MSTDDRYHREVKGFDPERANAYIKDTRSPLQQMLGESEILCERIEFAGSNDRLGEGHQFCFRRLFDAEEMSATRSAARYLFEVERWTPAELAVFDPVNVRLAHEEHVETLTLALVLPNDPKKQLVANSRELRKLLESEEIEFLYDQWLQWTATRSSYRKLVTDEQMRAYSDALGKGSAPKTSLNSFDAATLRTMYYELAVRHSKQMKDSSSGTGSST
jgi:hypothetical protein